MDTLSETLAQLGLPRLGPVVFLACSLLISLALAGLSWRFVEAPSLQLKHWRPFARARVPEAAGAPS